MFSPPASLKAELRVSSPPPPAPAPLLPNTVGRAAAGVELLKSDLTHTHSFSAPSLFVTQIQLCVFLFPFLFVLSFVFNICHR